MNKIKMGSNRNFGLLFFIVFLIISLFPLLNNEQIRTWSIFLSLFFLILALFRPKLLNPINKIWFKFGIALGSLVAPIVMCFIFFIIITPTGLLLKILGKDLLNKKYDNKINTYWIKRKIQLGSMKRQF